MGLSTHVLDTMHGGPDAGMAVELHTTRDGQATLVKRFVLNDDGRHAGGPGLDGTELQRGTYRLVFDVAAYFRQRGVVLPERGYKLNILTIIKTEHQKNILGISKKTNRIKGVALPEDRIEADDILVLFGEINDIRRLLDE